MTLAKNVQTEITELDRGGWGRVKLGSVSSSIGELPSAKLTAFARQHPGVSFDIYEDNTFGILDKLQGNLLDLAIVRTPYNRVNLNFVDISDEPMTAVTCQDFFPGKGKVGLQDLAGQPLVIYRRFEDMFKEAFAEKVSPQILWLSAMIPEPLSAGATLAWGLPWCRNQSPKLMPKATSTQSTWLSGGPACSWSGAKTGWLPP